MAKRKKPFTVKTNATKPLDMRAKVFSLFSAADIRGRRCVAYPDDTHTIDDRRHCELRATLPPSQRVALQDAMEVTHMLAHLTLMAYQASRETARTHLDWHDHWLNLVEELEKLVLEIFTKKRTDMTKSVLRLFHLSIQTAEILRWSALRQLALNTFRWIQGPF